MVAGVISTHLSPPVWDSPAWKVALTWDLGNGKIVHLLRAGDNFMSESVVNGKIERRPIRQAEPIPPEEFIEEMSALQAYINEDDSIEFLIKEKSKLNDVTIDEKNWGITIIESGSSDPFNPCSWEGHAVVVIEIIEAGDYHLWRGDARNNHDLAEVKLFEIKDFSQKFTWPRTKTWIRTSFLVKKMMQQIQLEAERSARKEPIGLTEEGIPIAFNPTASGLVGFVGDDGKTREAVSLNCIGWARRIVYLADIEIPRCIISDLQTPTIYIGSPERIIAHKITNTSATLLLAGGATKVCSLALSPLLPFMGHPIVLVAWTVFTFGLILKESYLESSREKEVLEKFKAKVTEKRPS